MEEKKTVVIGNGWAALASLYFLLEEEGSICWVPGTSAQKEMPLSTLTDGEGARVWEQIAARLENLPSSPEEGFFVKEFKNRTWRDCTPFEEGSLDERFFGRSLLKFSIPLNEIEQKLRDYLIHPDHGSRIERKLGVPIQGFCGLLERSQDLGVILGSGELIKCSRIVYADRWFELPLLDGLPKPLSFLRKREPLGALQATFIHEKKIERVESQNYLSVLSREKDQEKERTFFGYFSHEDLRSTWTFYLSPSEAEDNHQIGKKLRKLKTVLEKMFPEFSQTVTEEQVKFHDEFLFAEGNSLLEPVILPKNPEVAFLTDSYGPASSFAQARYLEKKSSASLSNNDHLALVEDEVSTSAPSPSLPPSSEIQTSPDLG